FSFSIINQIKSLEQIVSSYGKQINHIKAHGALYNEMIHDLDTADFYLDTIKDYKEKYSLYVPYQSEIEILALKRGFKIIYEVFADRNYNDDLSLVSRDKEFALINKPKEVIKHITSIIESNIVKTVSGNTYKIKFDTLCVHSDTNNSIEILKEINKVFKNR
ncbi:MAG: lactam utilization protein LamB, partial [Cryomorphaceae bacterium]|nr:lactam utilization protein LamB [Cryomorphaceae bacterium]